MPERLRQRRFGLGALLAAAAVALAIVPGAGAQSSPALHGWLSGGASFPARALDLFPPAGTSVSTANVHVSEGGVPVKRISVTPVSRAGPGDFGLILLLDRDVSLASGSLSAELAAARGLAAVRSGFQQLGVIAFDRTPTVLAPLSADSATLDSTLAQRPVTGAGDDVPAAVTQAVTLLTQAHLAIGAVVVVSDGVGLPASAHAAAVARAAALAANVPVITVGLGDAAASGASLRALASSAPGQYVSTVPARLASTLATIDRVVSRGYVVRWVSHEPPGRQVAVQGTVAGIPGSVQGSYRTPGSPAAVSPRPARPAAPLAPLSLAQLPALSPRPNFVSASVPRRSGAGAPGAGQTAPPSPGTGASGAQSFWNSPSSMTLVAGGAGLLIALALFLIFYRPAQRAARMRVGSFIPGPSEPAEDSADPARPDGAAASRSWLAQSRWWPEFVENVEVARSPRSPLELVKRAVGAALLLAALVIFVSGSLPLGLVPLVTWPFVLRAAMRRAARKQRAKFKDTLPGYLQDLASALRVGRSFVGAISVVAEGADEPTKGELERAVRDEALGLPLEESLEGVGRRMESPDMDQVALVAALNRRSGSNVAEALDRVADGARDRADMRREVKALTGQARMSSYVLTALPAVLLGAITVISPAYAHPLLHTTMGIVLLFVGAAMVFSGWKVMKKISDVKV